MSPTGTRLWRTPPTDNTMISVNTNNTLHDGEDLIINYCFNHSCQSSQQKWREFIGFKNGGQMIIVLMVFVLC